eukprot:jgi/Tetstr1/438245/TSEL_026814.t1
MGSDNQSTQPKRPKWRGMASNAVLLLVSFCLPFLFLLLMTHSWHLPDNHVSRRDSGFGGSGNTPRRSSRPMKPAKLHEATELLPAAAQPKQVPLPMDENLPEPCATCPVVESIAPAVGPVSGTLVVTITGQQLGSSRTLRGVTVGSVPCISFTSLDAAHLTCQIPPGTGANLPVIVTVETPSGQQRGASLTRGARWSYLPPK